MVVLSRGNQQTVIWMVAFNDEQGASLFADFYRQVLDRVDGAQNLQGVLDQNNGPTPHDLEQNGKNVLVVAGPGAAGFASLAPAVWQAAKISDPNPPASPLSATDEDQGSSVRRAYDYMKDLANQWLLPGANPRDPLKYNSAQ
jgi:hypothetical protein